MVRRCGWRCARAMLVLEFFTGATMPKDEKTSKRVGIIASEMLRDKKSTPAMKTVAGAALTQRPNHPKPKKKK